MSRHTPRSRVLLAASSGALLLLAACGGGTATAPGADSSAAPPATSAPTDGGATTGAGSGAEVDVDGELAPPEQSTTAVTYNPEIAPVGAEIDVEASSSDGVTTVRLSVDGMLPNRGYAAHAHDNPCGATGDAAGPHFQNEVDPAATPDAPSVDSAYANPQNEIWLDFQTDDDGDGETTTEVPFVFTDRAPASVIIHEAEMTSMEEGQAGTAGSRPACITVPFEQLMG